MSIWDELKLVHLASNASFMISIHCTTFEKMRLMCLY